MTAQLKTTRVPRAATKREQREASIEKILRSPLKLFVAKGYHSTAVDEIAAAAELTKGVVYFYFPSKSAVLLSLFDQLEDVLVDRMAEQVAHVGT